MQKELIEKLMKNLNITRTEAAKMVEEYLYGENKSIIELIIIAGKGKGEGNV